MLYSLNLLLIKTHLHKPKTQREDSSDAQEICNHSGLAFVPAGCCIPALIRPSMPHPHLQGLTTGLPEGQEFCVCRYLTEASGDFVGAEGNPVKAYEIGEVAADEIGSQLLAFDAQVSHSQAHAIAHALPLAEIA